MRLNLQCYVEYNDFIREIKSGDHSNQQWLKVVSDAFYYWKIKNKELNEDVCVFYNKIPAKTLNSWDKRQITRLIKTDLYTYFELLDKVDKKELWFKSLNFKNKKEYIYTESDIQLLLSKYLNDKLPDINNIASYINKKDVTFNVVYNKEHYNKLVEVVNKGLCNVIVTNKDIFINDIIQKILENIDNKNINNIVSLFKTLELVGDYCEIKKSIKNITIKDLCFYVYQDGKSINSLDVLMHSKLLMRCFFDVDKIKESMRLKYNASSFIERVSLYPELFCIAMDSLTNSDQSIELFYLKNKESRNTIDKGLNRLNDYPELDLDMKKINAKLDYFCIKELAGNKRDKKNKLKL